MINPLVSILMTAYNRQKFIAEAIESVLASTYENWELIIVDDGSNDNTVPIAKSYAVKDSRINVYLNEKNLGDYPNRNKAAGYAKGEYLVYVDSDDTLLTDTLHKLVQIISVYPTAGYAAASPMQISNVVFMTSREIVRKHFFEAPILMYGPGAMCIRRNFFEEIGGFTTEYGPANDMYFHLKAANAAPVLLLPFQLINYRRHEGQEINNHYGYLYNNYLCLKNAINQLNLPLSSSEKKYLSDKNRRRFIVNLCRFAIISTDIQKVKEAKKKAGFTFADFCKGFIHFHHKPTA